MSASRRGQIPFVRCASPGLHGANRGAARFSSHGEHGGETVNSEFQQGKKFSATRWQQ